MAPVNHSASLEEGEVPLDANFVQQYEEPQVLRIVRLTVFAIIMLGSLVGNTVVIRAVVRAKGFKTVTYFLICNLALAEIVSSSCLPFMQAYDDLASWPFSDAMCHLINPLQLTAGIVVTTSITAIAMNRCLLVVRPRLHGSSSCTVGAFCLNLIIWASAFVIAMPSFIYMTKIPSANKDGKFWCVTLFPGDAIENGYPSSRVRTLITLHLILNYAVPITLTIISYSVVIAKLKFQSQVAVAHIVRYAYDNTETQTERFEMSNESCQREKKESERRSTETPNETPAFGPKTDPKQENPAPRDELRENESDLLRMFYAIVVIFIVCYLPYQTFFMLEYMGQLSWKNWEYFSVTRKFLYLLTCCPSALHPICYGMMSRFYYKAFAKLVLCK
ncbi:somatostatin receptor type 2-like [Actinia tenebrosa]|uniref:Somatostatin receptor type 2-like n=1 Tax=Actinia tenebrosa TaxID=6105 RepID=A0A6P8GY78_ACTTE|nr:somatostatin receptor type 2-like [Actinia tenebrosa]